MKGEGRVYQRQGRPVWMLDYYGEVNGKRVRLRESSGTTDEAAARRKLRDRVSSSYVAEKTGGDVETSAHRRYTVGEALADYVRDLQMREKKGWKNEWYRLRPESPLCSALGHVPVRQLSRARLVGYVEARRKENCANKTINNDLQGLRSALRLAVKAGRVLRLPAFPDKLGERVREGFPEAWEPEALAAAALEKAPWLAEMVRFAYVTGWRRGELLALRWEWIDWEERQVRLPGVSTKNGRGRVVPIAGELVAIMERLREARSVVHESGSVALAETVFHDAGQPITRKRFVLAWSAARKAAKLPHRLFHDFRRAAARRMTNAGVPQVVAMKITGHETDSMFRRYAIVETSDMASAFQRVAAPAGRGASSPVVPMRRKR